MAIPKKMHYVWVGSMPIPKRDQEYIAGWQKLNPDFELRRWTEQDIDLQKYPLVAKALREERWALASDIIRMYVIYEQGGIYMDTDIELLKPLEPLLKYDGFAGWESNFWFTTAIFGAKKHSPWIGKVLKRYELANPRQRITTDTFLKTVHSPSVYAKDIYGLELDGQTRVYADGKFAVFATEYFSPKHYMTGKVNLTENTIAYHHYASTWHTRREAMKNELSRTGYKILGANGYAKLEKEFNKGLERKIRKELP
jgi:Mannosyltransferase OCH1 and related enzymes